MQGWDRIPECQNPCLPRVGPGVEGIDNIDREPEVGDVKVQSVERSVADVDERVPRRDEGTESITDGPP